MFPKLTEVGLLALALSVGVAAQSNAPLVGSTTAPSGATALPEKNASGRSDASLQAKARPTLAQLDQPGAVVIPPPILRNEGRTAITPDRPLLGRLSLKTLQVPLIGQPPAIQPEPNEAALSSSVDVAGVPRRAQF
jgi:hypothetical protein